jgi:hypothetical protein
LKKQLQLAAGIIFSAALTFAAQSAMASTAYPAAPATAVVYASAQNRTVSGYCSSSTCSGGSGNGVAWIAQNQSTPSQSGRSAELFNSGEGFDTLWYWHVGAEDKATNIEFEFSLMVDENSLKAEQAFENGPQQYVGGYKYSMTMQCEGSKQLWRVWDQAAKGWKATSVPCPHWTPNVWHTVKMYITTDHTNHTETYHSLVVDGKTYSIETTVGVTNVGFHDNLGFQFQIDNNKTSAAGNGIHEWLDNIKLAVW